MDRSEVVAALAAYYGADALAELDRAVRIRVLEYRSMERAPIAQQPSWNGQRARWAASAGWLDDVGDLVRSALEQQKDGRRAAV